MNLRALKKVLGGWLSQRRYDKEHLDSYITPHDFDLIKSWGLDHVRLPVDYNILDDTDEGCSTVGFDYIDMAVKECERVGLNLVIDLHKTAGFYFATGYNYAPLFEKADLQERFFKIWECLAKRYGKKPDRIAFELLNEVTCTEFAEPYNELAKKCTERIRAYAPDTYVIVGSVWNNSVDSVHMLAEPYDEKIVYTFHCYDPHIFTHQGARFIRNMPWDLRVDYPLTANEYRAIEKEKTDGLDVVCTDMGDRLFSADAFIDNFSRAVEYAEKNNAPLYCGEYGVIENASPDATLRWFKDINTAFEHYGISRAIWSYQNMGFGMTDSHLGGVFSELKKYF